MLILLITLSLVPAIVFTVFISLDKNSYEKRSGRKCEVQSHLVESLTAIETVKAAQFE